MKEEIKNFKAEMKKIRIPLQKVVGHERRERHNKAKKKAIAKKMSKENPFKEWQKIDRKHIKGNYPAGYKENNE